MRTFGERFVNPEAPIDVAPEDNPTNEPEPDLLVLATPTREFRDFQPIEAELYARAGIIEYWVVADAARRLIVHREPIEGLYRAVTAYSEEETVSPLASPECEFRVLDAFEA